MRDGRWLRHAVDLVLPVTCLGCGQRAVAWCDQCRSDALDLHIREHASGLQTIAAATYDGDVRDAILGYKERGRRDVLAGLGWLLDAAIEAAAVDLSRPVLVPMPSTPAAVRRRGGDHMIRLVRSLEHDAPVVKALGTRSAADSAELSATGRRVTRGQAMFARRGAAELLRERDVVLIDDIVTTGATLEQAARIAGALGARSVRAAVVAHTPKEVSGR